MIWWILGICGLCCIIYYVWQILSIILDENWLDDQGGPYI
jgi:hypothetical protein